MCLSKNAGWGEWDTERVFVLPHSCAITTQFQYRLKFYWAHRIQCAGWMVKQPACTWLGRRLGEFVAWGVGREGQGWQLGSIQTRQQKLKNQVETEFKPGAMFHSLGDLWQATWPPLCSNKPNCKFAGKLKTRCCIWEAPAQAKFLDTHLQGLCVLWAVLIWLSVTADKIKVIFGNKFQSDFCFILSLLNIILISFEGEKDGLSFYLNIDQNSKEPANCLPEEHLGYKADRNSHSQMSAEGFLQRLLLLMAIARLYVSPTTVQVRSCICDNLTYQLFAFLFWYLVRKVSCPLLAFCFLFSSHCTCPLWGQTTFGMLMG